MMGAVVGGVLSAVVGGIINGVIALGYSRRIDCRQTNGPDRVKAGKDLEDGLDTEPGG
ncbi:MAG: hypothetical protein BECKG1743D_GA0114223_102292 [Candidatus Kentron sp. G]|nr:MAG: hypothetical protein BECKG1743F_GA0114225_102242 [Candidatus Kentron sp. G]VFM99053.1 MAG: hypothetical protein BECKG1743E_GA0114224_102272 [Candidatus Kentron sp. G]VFN00854.1 MAG: hypothetical protein BECKG1743D_GA0114223_102292 [Candidatus Kentron sp. G]